MMVSTSNQDGKSICKYVGRSAQPMDYEHLDNNVYAATT